MGRSSTKVFSTEIVFIATRAISLLAGIIVVALYSKDIIFLNFLKIELLPILIGSLLFRIQYRPSKKIIFGVQAFILVYFFTTFDILSIFILYIISEANVQTLMYQVTRNKNILYFFLATIANFIFLIIAYCYELNFGTFIQMVVLTSTLLSSYYTCIISKISFTNNNKASYSILRQLLTIIFRYFYISPSITMLQIYLLKFINSIVIYSLSFSKSSIILFKSISHSKVNFLNVLLVSLWLVSISLAYIGDFLSLALLFFCLSIIISVYMENSSYEQ